MAKPAPWHRTAGESMRLRRRSIVKADSVIRGMAESCPPKAKLMKDKTYKQRKREKLEQARLKALQYGWKPPQAPEPPKRPRTFRIKNKKPPVTNFVAEDQFLTTFEWRKVRVEALKKYGPKCMCCGATPADGAVMNVDHIKPRKLWPSLALDVNNLQILCHDCNHGKGNWDQTDWRKQSTNA